MFRSCHCVVAAFAYTVMHGLWLAAAGVLALAALLGWLGRKIFAEKQGKSA